MDTANVQEETIDVLKSLDIIIAVDHSGSMSKPSTRMAGKTRFEEVEEEVGAIARQAEKYDDDGLTVIPFAATARVYDGVTSDKVETVFKEFQPGGSTNLAAAISEASKKTRASKKDVLVIIFTDGEPDSYDAVETEINSAGKEFGRPRIGFFFAQVGNEQGATKFLSRIDNDLKVDICATRSEEATEALSLGQIAWLARNA